MSSSRSSGVLLHPTSLPGRFGIGDLGASAFEFIDLLAAAGQRLWQVLPLGPTGYGNSPYQCFSAFAGNPLLIAPRRVDRRGMAHLARGARPDERLLTETSISLACSHTARRSGHACSIASMRRLPPPCAIASTGSAAGMRNGWTISRSSWPSRPRTIGTAWTTWEPDIAQRDPSAVARWSARLRPRRPDAQADAVPLLRAVAARARRLPLAGHRHHGRSADLRRP